MPDPVRVGYRSFDRQWLIPDSRVLDMPRSDLWASRRVPGQVFIIEQHSHAISDGPGIVATSLLPDLHHFNNRGGRALPFLHPDGTPNVAPGVLTALSSHYGTDVTAADLLAYVAGVVAHPAYTRRFEDELSTPGIRVPVTADATTFDQAVSLGRQVLWLHTYGDVWDGDNHPSGSVRFPHEDPRQPLAVTAITAMPESVTYDADRETVLLGNGEFGPVTPPVWDYTVGGRNVIRSWVNYRKKDPTGRKTSPLDHTHVTAWDPDWTSEFIDLLTVLTRLVELEPAQEALLAEVLDREVLTMNELTQAGVTWPEKTSDRKARYGTQMTLDV